MSLEPNKQKNEKSQTTLIKLLQTSATVILIIILTACTGETASTSNGPNGANDRIENYELIHSIIRTSELPETSLSRYEIEPERDKLLLTLVIKDKKTGNNVRAQVDVGLLNAAGQHMEIEVEELVANDMVSYVGTLEVLQPVFLDFKVRYRPQGEAEVAEIDFREEFLNIEP